MPRDRRISAASASWILAVLVLVIAAEARFLGLDARSLWFDEAFSLTMAKMPLLSMVRWIPGNDTHPPLYYALLGGWVHLFGSSEAAVRSLSALIGFLMVPLLYAFAREMVEPHLAFVASALLAGSAFATVAAQEARMYALLGLLALASWHSLRLGLRRERAWAWALYVVSSALMLYTHYFGFLVLGSQVLYVLPLARHDRRALVTAALAMAASLALFLPWVPGFLAQATSGRPYPTFRDPVHLRGIEDLLALFAFGGQLLDTGGYFYGGAAPLWKESLLLLPFAALVAAGAYAMRGERAWCLFCYLIVPVAAALAFSVRLNFFYPRYFSFLEPPFALLLASGIGAAATRFARGTAPRPGRRLAAVAALVIVVLAANAPVVTGYESHKEYDWRGAAAFVSHRAGPDDYLVFVPGFAHLPFEYYYKGMQKRKALTPVEEYRMVRIKTPPTPDVDKAWARRLAEAHPRLWIIATEPLPLESYLRLRALFRESFDQGHAWDFNSVYVFSLESRRYSAPGGGR
jgi:mannosyltransferase